MVRKLHFDHDLDLECGTLLREPTEWPRWISNLHFVNPRIHFHSHFHRRSHSESSCHGVLPEWTSVIHQVSLACRWLPDRGDKHYLMFPFSSGPKHPEGHSDSPAYAPTPRHQQEWWPADLHASICGVCAWNCFSIGDCFFHQFHICDYGDEFAERKELLLWHRGI